MKGPLADVLGAVTHFLILTHFCLGSHVDSPKESLQQAGREIHSTKEIDIIVTPSTRRLTRMQAFLSMLLRFDNEILISSIKRTETSGDYTKQTTIQKNNTRPYLLKYKNHDARHIFLLLKFCLAF